MKQIQIMTIIAFVFVAQFIFAGQLTVEEKTLDFQQLLGRIKSSYGPLEYKKSTLNIDIDKLQTEYLRRIQESKTNDEFYYVINQFVAEFKDSHFSAMTPSDRRSALPFFVDLVQGKVLVDTQNTSVPFTDTLTVKKGDEITHINGVPVQDVIQSLLPYVGEGFEQTRKRMATWMLTSRRAARLPLIDGPVELTIKTVGKNETRTEKFSWIQTGDDLPETIEAIQTKLDLWSNTQSARPSYLQNLSIKSQMAKTFGDGQKIERNFFCSGTTRIEIPAHAVKISETPFVSYYWPTAKGNIGYVRIGHYSPEGEDADKAIALTISQYEKVIGIMEKNTVGLIIDQDHNCGGYIDLVNKMVGLFMDKPYRPMSFKFVANKENVLEYKKYAAEIDPLSSWYDMTMKVFELLKTTWQTGTRLTDFTSLNGDEWIQPNLIHYTKPVVMLIDEMSASGGDAFPALMQGYGRAKLLGTRTMGAGGHVTENPPLNYSQIEVSMTRSMFFRPDGVPVENNGAVPDYKYEITTDDFVNDYKDYQKFYTEKLLDLVK
jgi:C-terminal processing protease CtpA/Prc